ncbi:hypothetical protein BDV27DRAFT_164032 [Aspergillus caelatus]|uniref:DAPG hydrolase PhiG domain-containing protein n=1 Tax=Aspergillus caelatus TaxID=61420 RepID=A0A5N6ZKE5_9EURO|nr:uncharacterized protein BDV27DRAFT_164032 [Aspergillus caelatus]KAE8357945.1 hypothetical protein BDV27DRAFT_164032 [Aspergillus caelatus]
MMCKYSLPLLTSVAFALAFDKQPTSSVAATPTLLSQRAVSTNVASYVNDTSAYYLGYCTEDYIKYFFKYYNPKVAAISEEVSAGLQMSPDASALAFEATEAHKLLVQPGYLEIENGYATDANGTYMVTARTEMGTVTGEMYDWWFGWHLVDSSRYKLWNPIAHQYAWRYPNEWDWTNKAYAERYINTFTFIDEYLGADSSKLTVAFVDPSELNIDKSKWAEQGIETMVVARIAAGVHETSDFNNHNWLIHQLRRLPNGRTELCSRFWLQGINDQLAHGLVVHCNIEMTHLASFLPQIFEEYKNTI